MKFYAGSPFVGVGLDSPGLDSIIPRHALSCLLWNGNVFPEEWRNTATHVQLHNNYVTGVCFNDYDMEVGEE